MFLLIYDISGIKDLHGLRMRLIYALRKQNAIQLMRSTWLISSIEPELRSILDECIYQGYSVLLSKWDPVYLPEHIHEESSSLTDLLIGIVIHSPEVIELGVAKDFLNRLERSELRYHAILGGVMGRLAILDAQLEEKVFINHPYKPSEAIDYLIKKNVNLIIILNQGISQESGLEFGRQIVDNSKLLPFFKIPVIQLDRLQDNDAFMVCWTKDHSLFQKWLTENYHLNHLSPLTPQENLKIEGESVTRILRAVQVGDKILVNGVVIGEVTANQVEIIAKSNQIHEIKGGYKNFHGIEKLGAVDLRTARITTLKSLRRVHTSQKRKISGPRRENTAMLTWRGEQVYFQADKIDCIVSIGDDTTFVATEIISRFSRPIIGIIDGDADGILYDESNLVQLTELAPPNSLFIQVQPNTDDIAGDLIKTQIFKSRVKMKYSNLDDLKKEIMNVIKDYVIEKITT